nr:ferredoxin-type protein NapF [Motilimonas eburnea]
MVALPWRDQSVSFTDGCSRCGECISACETQIIVKGDGGFPSLDFNQGEGECSFCKQCATVCPEPLFDLSQSEPWQLKAQIKESCLANQDVYCRSCGEQCETQAISFKPGISSTPLISLADCTGCGACLSVCPVDAIALNPPE